MTWIPETAGTEVEVEVSPEVTIIHGADDETIEANNKVPQEEGYLGIPSSISVSGSADTLVPSAPSSPSNISNVTLIGSTGSNEKCDETPTATEPCSSFKYGKAPTSPLPERIVPKRPPRTIEQQASVTDSTVTAISKSQQLPQTTSTIKSISSSGGGVGGGEAIKPSIIKIAPTSSLTASNIVTITSSTVITASTAKTTITAPSIGVTFDRYSFSFF